MELSNKKLLIFDYDGTIADTSKSHEKAFHKVLDKLEIKFDYSRIAGLNTKDAIKDSLIANNLKFSNDEILNLVKKKQEIFKTIIDDQIQVITGADEFIKWVHYRYHLSIGSSGSKNNVLKGLNLLGLFKFFNDIVCSEDVNNAKPDPEIFKKVLAITNFSNNEALIFEDSDNGILAAIRANIDYVDLRQNSFKDLLCEFKKNAF